MTMTYCLEFVHTMYVQNINQGHLDFARLDLALAAIVF